MEARGNEEEAGVQTAIATVSLRSRPGGEQMDFVEVMEIEDGLIRRHCVYWGWYGVRLLEDDRHRA